MQKKGFTLVELLAVIVVLAIILAIAIPSISGIIKNPTKRAFNYDAKMVIKAIEYQKLENDRFNPLEVTKENMMETIGLSDYNYEQVSILIKNGVIEVVLVGQGKWDGFTAYGSIKNMRVVDSEDYDATPPSITILGDNPKEVGKGTVYYDEGATASDLKDGIINIFSVVIKNANNVVVDNIDTSTFTTYTITYTAVDSQGNIAISIRRVNIVDKTKPVITILGDNPININADDIYNDEGATALDETDGDITNSIIVTGSVNPSVVGTYTITYTVKDAANNQTTATRTVNVVTPTLTSKILFDNTLITAAPTLTTSSNNTSDASGLYSSNNTTNGNATYYFRGNVTNNYVSFADLTWRIVRINEDGSIRLILQDGINSNTYYFFNSSYSTASCMYYSNSTDVRSTLNSWYTSTLAASYASYIKQGATYCQASRVVYGSSYKTSANEEIYSSYTPTFACFTDGNGYGTLSLNIGLLTYDEAVFAGGYYGVSNSSYYLYNSSNWWAMSPAGFSGAYALAWTVNTSGDIGLNNFSYAQAMRPVINLNATVLYSSGDGSSENPYTISY